MTLVIHGVLNSGAMPVLERMLQFTSARHGLITHNIANLDTPNYRPTDLSTASFQQALAEAVDRRRRDTGGSEGPLPVRDTPEIGFGPASVHGRAVPRDQNILFHDRNNRSLEDHMKDLAENAMVHNTAVELLRHEFEMLDVAIRERF